MHTVKLQILVQKNIKGIAKLFPLVLFAKITTAKGFQCSFIENYKRVSV